MKASIVLGAIALALLGYILIFERGTLGTRELEARSGSVLPELIRARVVKLEIQRKGVTTVLERNPEGLDEESLWRVAAPYQAKADQEAVDTLLGDLEWLHAKRTLRDVSDEDLQRFGLAAPRYRAWFTVGRVRVGVRVGSETPQRDGVYVLAREPKTVFVVGKDFAEALGHPPEHYHTKDLHDGVLVATARRVEVRDAGGERVVARRPDGLWAIALPSASKDMLAASAEITTVIEAADALRATRYVTSEKGALPRYGLEPAQLELAIHKRGVIDLQKKGNDGPDVLAVRVRAGAACEGHPAERYVTVGDGGLVFCAQSADLDKLALPAERLVETRLLPIDPKDIRGVRLARGDRALVLERVGGIPQFGEAEPWRYEQKRGDKVVAQGNARDGSIQDFLSGLRAAVALSDAPSAGDAKGAGFTATFQRNENKPDVVLHVALRGLDEALVHRQGEPASLAFAPAAVEALDPSAAPFRSLALLSLGESALRSVEITRGGARERLERGEAGAGFAVTDPIEAEADRIATSDVARLLSGLQALRFAAEGPEPVHGLDAPALMLRAQYAAAEGGEPRTITLRVGAATEGGSFAQLGDDRAVFVVAAQLVDLLKAPLASRTLLAVPLERIARLELSQGGKTVRVQRAGDGFEVEGRPGDAAAAQRARALAEAVATLRAATVAGYGEPAPEQGFKAPHAALRVEDKDGEAIEISFGAALAGGERYARRRDLAATFVLPASAAAALTTLP